MRPRAVMAALDVEARALDGIRAPAPRTSEQEGLGVFLLGLERIARGLGWRYDRERRCWCDAAGEPVASMT